MESKSEQASVNPFLNFLSKTTGLFLSLFNGIKFLIERQIYILRWQARPDDVYISTYMKSGTTWTQMVLYQLTTDGNMDFEHLNDVSPWLELAFAEKQNLVNFKGRRFLKTHLFYNQFPSKLKGKIIYVMRDGMDVAVSQYYHFKNFHPTFLTWDETFSSSLKNFFWQNSKKSWFSHLKGWLINKRNFEMLVLKYEDLHKYPDTTIEKICEFCDIPLNEALLERVKERMSLSFMKKHQEKLGPKLPEGESPKGDFIRKGKMEEGWQYFGKDEMKKYCDLFEKELTEFGLDSYDPKKRDFSRMI